MYRHKNLFVLTAAPICARNRRKRNGSQGQRAGSLHLFVLRCSAQSGVGEKNTKRKGEVFVEIRAAMHSNPYLNT